MRRFSSTLAAALAVLVLSSASVASAAEGHAQTPPDRQQRLTSAESYIPVPTLSAGVLNHYSTMGTLIVDMGLDVQDPALRNRAQLNGPLLRDALRTALSTYANTYYHDRTEPDPVQLTRLMQAAVDRTLNARGAQVLLANILYQRRTS